MMPLLPAHELENWRGIYLDSIRQVLLPAYQEMDDEAVASLLSEALDQMSPDEKNAFAVLSLQNTYEGVLGSIGRGLRSVGRTVSRALPSVARVVAPVAQVAAPLVGTMIGGPVGGMAGSALGNLLGSLAGGGARPAAPAAPGMTAPTAPVATGVAAPAAPAAAPVVQPSPAASQLMSLLANPQLLQALLGQVLGGIGNSAATVRRAGESINVPFPALMHTLSELAQRAAVEAIEGGGTESADYLRDRYGNFQLEEASDAGRHADIVLDLLRAERAVDYMEMAVEAADDNDPVTDWLVSAGLVR